MELPSGTDNALVAFLPKIIQISFVKIHFMLKNFGIEMNGVLNFFEIMAHSSMILL